MSLHILRHHLEPFWTQPRPTILFQNIDKFPAKLQYLVNGFGFMTVNMNGQLGLVNGTPVETHSLRFSSSDEYNRVMAVITQGETLLPFGSEIEIDPPFSVNVCIPTSLNGKTVSEKRKQQIKILRKHSLDKNKIIIPLLATKSRHHKQKQYAYFNNDPFNPCSTATVTDPFPFELAFAATIHKAQGRTMDKVVIDLYCHPDGTHRLNFAQVFVALSRVKTRENIRLIQHPNASNEEAYSYITQLKPHPDVVAFYKGFKPSTSGGFIWDANLALS